jgi:type II secretory pathway component GspD/PulD (secretin)
VGSKFLDTARFEREASAAEGPPARSTETAETGTASDANETARSTEADRPQEPNKPEERVEATGPGSETTASERPDDPLEAVNLKDVEMKFIIEKIAKWTGKVVIPTDEVMKLKLTIYAPDRLRRSEALTQIYGALRIKGFVAEQSENTIFLRPIGDARLGFVPTIPPEQPLAALANKEQIVQKFFRLTNYSPTQMAQLVQPLIGEYGHVSVEETSGSLSVIDTVANLLRIETIIGQFDTTDGQEIQTEIFAVRHRDPGEIVQLLQVLLVDRPGSAPGGPRQIVTPNPARANPNTRGRPAGRQGGSVAATSVVTGAGRKPMLLIPEPRFGWIIAKAAADDMANIRTWIEKLDIAVPTVTAEKSLDDLENKNQVVQRFVSLKDSSPSRIAEIVGPLLTDNGYLSADDATGSLLLVDTVENLIRVEGVIAQFDVPDDANTAVTVFEIHHGDPLEIIALLQTLLADDGAASAAAYIRNAAARARSTARPGSRSVVIGARGRSVVLIPVLTHNWIIAKASAHDVQEVAKWIERLDKAVPTLMDDGSLADIENKKQIVQKFVKLQHYNPSRMGEIVAPLLGDAGYLSVDETSGRLLLIDTVDNLLRIEAIIGEFDVPQAENTATQIFEVRHRAPDEIVALLETILADDQGQTGAITYQGRLSSSPSRRRSLAIGGGRTNRRASVVIGTAARPVVLIPEPTQNWVIVKAAPEDVKQIGVWIERLDQAVATLTADTPLSDIENKNQVVQQCIKLANYSPSQMAEIVLPLLGASGYVSADESTRNLLLIDTVENLMRIEAVIAQFDVPEAEQTVTQIYEISHADPAEVVQLLRLLLSDGTGRTAGGLRRGGTAGMRGRTGGTLYRSNTRGSAATSVLVGPSDLPIVLIPEPRRKWIIARASAEDMRLLGEWIAKLDNPEPVERDYETVSIIYADVREVSVRLNEALQQMPGTELQASVLVQPLEQARQVMIFGRQDLREMVKKFIGEIDVPPGQFETRHFDIRHADPDRIKVNLDELYGDNAMLMARSTANRTAGVRPTGGVSADMVKIISHVSLKQITVIASPENLKRIEEQIVQWDVPVNVHEVKPRIIELRNSDPVQMVTLLTSLFSTDGSSSYSYYDLLFGSGGRDRERIVGPLYGQVTFEQVPGTKKIIVISNIPEAYSVVEALIEELDSRKAAEVPRVIRLNYADPENLAERLNAMFNEAGTSATIRLSERGLSAYSMDEATGGAGGNARANTVGQADSRPGEYRPWWTAAAGRQGTGEMPISNIIGRVRFIPDTHSKSILVLAPVEFVGGIEQMIADLDVPGKQVMLKAIIVQVDHQNMTSLGVQVSSDPTKWQTLDNENAIVAWNALSLLEKHGSMVFGAGGESGSATEVGIGADVGVLIDFLVRELDAKILNQQTLWTKDNEEAQFFKGQRVGFQTRVSISDTGGRATSDFEYEKVGMTLRARPSITPEKNVDMIINVILSQLTSEVINNQRVRTELDTTTNMIVQDGQTIMLGGMLFQEDSKIKRKVPLFGDLPIVGGLFRHKENVVANSELLIFVTPYVIEGPGEMLPEATDALDRARRTLSDVRRQLGSPASDSDPE